MNHTLFAIKRITTLLLLIALMQQTSCKKYLEKKSFSDQVVPSNLDDIQALLDNEQVMNRTAPGYMEASADDYFLPATTYASLASDAQKFYTWRPYYYSFGNDWSLNYNAIYYSNLSLELLEKIPITPSNELKWVNLKGSALFFRATHLLQLSWAFSKAFDESTATTDLGIVLKLESDFNKPTTRTSVKESYEQIIKDAKESAIYLPDFPQITTRPSKGAAYGLLARTYLSMRRYDSALKYSNLSLQIKNQLLNYSSSPVNPIGNNPFPDFKTNPEIIFYQQTSSYHTTFATSSALIDTNLYSTYSTFDHRRSAFFANVTVMNRVYKKFKGSYTNNSTTFFSGIATDEMYLIRAECFARRDQPGDKNLALDDLNTLLAKRWQSNNFTPVQATSTALALDTILLERRKELVMRDLRWIDIKRLNKEGRNIILTRNPGQLYTLQPNANYYALPLPGDIIDLTVMPQNPQ